MLEGFSLGSCLLLVDVTGRLCRQRKARLSREVASILKRLETGAEVWGQPMRKLFGKARLLGSYFSTDCQRLRDVACRRGAIIWTTWWRRSPEGWPEHPAAGR